MSEKIDPRYGIDPYLDWVAKEGLKVNDVVRIPSLPYMEPATPGRAYTPT